MRVAGELAEAGARVAEICEQLHRSQSRSQYELSRIVYANTRLSRDGRLAWSTASQDEIFATGCDASSIDHQVEIPRSIAGVLVAIMFSQGEPGVVRMSFRGEGGVAVRPLAEQFGGGGHHTSAGARFRGTLEDALARVLPAAHAYVAALRP